MLAWVLQGSDWLNLPQKWSAMTLHMVYKQVNNCTAMHAEQLIHVLPQTTAQVTVHVCWSKLLTSNHISGQAESSSFSPNSSGDRRSTCSKQTCGQHLLHTELHTAASHAISTVVHFGHDSRAKSLAAANAHQIFNAQTLDQHTGWFIHEFS